MEDRRPRDGPLIGEFYRLEPKQALSIAGLVAHLSITQAVNGVSGVHALLPHDALEFVGADA